MSALDSSGAAQEAVGPELCDKRYRAMGLNEYAVVGPHKVESGTFRDENLAAEEAMLVERPYTGATLSTGAGP